MSTHEAANGVFLLILRFQGPFVPGREQALNTAMECIQLNKNKREGLFGHFLTFFLEAVAA